MYQEKSEFVKENRSQLVCCVRNEAVYLLEWIAHHRILGFDDIVIFSNDCTDGTHEILEEAANLGLCRHFRNIVAKGEFPQKSAYRMYDTLKLRQGVRFQMTLDSDEFLNIHIGDNRLPDLLNAVAPKVDILCLNWMNFGAGDHETWSAGNITTKFLMASPPNAPCNQGVKSLIQNPQNFGTLRNHHPKNFVADRAIVARNANGKALQVPTKHNAGLWRSLRRLGRDDMSHNIAQINHYATKTYDSYRMRQNRGRGWGDHDRHDDQRFERLNKNLQFETSILRYRTQLDSELAMMRGLGQLGALEQKARELYREKLSLLELAHA